ncbi:MAG TPA: PilZ domain-containing protein [Candidatus Acidoferrum sp.]|nr:PilZ domain-containing protein [Candidatus Acidoferrum sp.]
MGQSSNVSTHAGPRRRSQRVLMQVGVRIRGDNVEGVSFEEETSTLAINAHGALILLQARITSGSRVHMQHKGTQQEQECHVVFLGPVRSGKAEVGLEFSSPCPTFWRVAFPPEDWSPKHPEARTVISTNSHKR